LRDENSVLPVSSRIDDYYEISDVCLSIPSVVNRNGREKFLRLELSGLEQEQFRHSAATLKDIMEKINV